MDLVGSRALIVDDELDLLDTLRRLLGRCGYTCLTASSGAEAIALIDAEAPDVVVTDLHMSGIERHGGCPPCARAAAADSRRLDNGVCDA
jgi:CheY-like chemotaxis protein